MYPDEENFYRRCIKSGIILDANVLTMYLVGKNAGASAISNHKRAMYDGYMHGDFDVLEWIVEHSRKIVTTRYILSQVSDLYPLEDTEKGKAYYSSKAIDLVRNVVIEDCTEIDALSSRGFTKKFGYADASIIEIANKEYSIVTVDGPLVGFLQSINHCVVDMNRLRVMYVRETKTLKAFT